MAAALKHDRNGSTGMMAVRYCLLAALTVGYGWGYRGTVGHEYGAMVPGALLGLMLCLGSGRPDWHRRAAAAGLFAAVGWAWGGSMSYMEQTFYVLSDSFPDVLYGYAALFFLGALWAGCGGALLGIGLTAPRSELECLIRPFTAACSLFFPAFVYFQFMPRHNLAYEEFTVRHFHDGKWFSATLTLVACGLYWFVSPRDRRGTALLFWGAVAWWMGYGLLTKLGGIRLAPLHRSESWGGVLGILVVLIIYLVRRNNRAALMLCLYGCVGGGLSFVLAVFIHNSLLLRWGPIAAIGIDVAAWRCTEVSFGFFMGLSLAVGALRLLRGGIAPPVEDRHRVPLDTFAVFVITVALAWINFRRHFARVLDDTPATDDNTLLGMSTGGWYFLVAMIVTMPALHLLNRYRLGDRGWVPQSAFGKGAAVALFLIGTTVAGQLFDGYPTRMTLIGHLVLWIPSSLATCLLVSLVARAEQNAELTTPGVPADDVRWRVGRRFFVVCALMPLAVFAVAGLSVLMQEESVGERGRLRFGPEAYWRQTERLQGEWDVVGFSEAVGGTAVTTRELPFIRFSFTASFRVSAVSRNEERIDNHRWFLKNQYIWLRWFEQVEGRDQQVEIPIRFQDERLYIAWPPRETAEGYLVLERR